MARQKNTAPAPPADRGRLEAAEAAFATADEARAAARTQRDRVAELKDKAEAAISEAKENVRRAGEALGLGDAVTASLHDDAVLSYTQAQARFESYRDNALPAAEAQLKARSEEWETARDERRRMAIRQAAIEAILPAETAFFRAIDAAGDALAEVHAAYESLNSRFGLNGLSRFSDADLSAGIPREIAALTQAKINIPAYMGLPTTVDYPRLRGEAVHPLDRCRAAWGIDAQGSEQ